MPRQIHGLVLAVSLAVGLGAPALVDVARADEVLRWFPPRLKGGGVIAVPKAYYSRENDFGVGVQVVRPFRFPGADELADDSDVRLDARYNLDGHGEVEFEGTTVFGAGQWSAKFKAGYDALALRFWGVGSDTPSEDEEVYRPQDTQVYLEVFRELVSPSFRVGVRAEWQDYRYLEVEPGGLLDTRPYPGTHHDNVLGGGLVWEIDTRDNRYAPTRGLFAQGYWLWFGSGGSDFEFSNVHADVRAYVDVGGDAVLALQGFTYALFGDAPIWRYGAVGGRAHSRGYRRARFLERRMGAVQAELRRPLFWRLDAVVFGGLANVARRYNTFKLANMRPTLGGGLRLHLQERRDLIIRGDLAVGEGSLQTYFSFGHAF